MAIYHLNAKVISRAQGRSATAASAYRAGQKIVDERTGLVFDYTRKREVIFRQIFAPASSPAWVHYRQALWNNAEKSEVRKDAQIAREIEVALPLELSHKQREILLDRFITTQFVKQGMVADVCIHDKPGNPHAHILLTTRDINNAGFGKKNRYWNSKEMLEKWRSEWASHTNRRLKVAGAKCSIDHRTLEAQGIDRLPGRHIGPQSKAMQARGLPVPAIQIIQTTTQEAIMNENNIKLDQQTQERTWQDLMGHKPMFISMPMSTDAQDKAEQNKDIFTKKYLEMLQQLFEDEFVSIARANTEIGVCLELDFHPGAVWDYGSQMKAMTGSAEEINAMLRLAKAKEWPGIHLSGSDEFKERVFIQAVLTGAYKPEEITGYEPSARAMEIIAMAGVKPTSKVSQKLAGTPEENGVKSPATKLKV
ncbi:MAG: MobA/MobL family protein [Burkholderiaceae bacterium]|nr:MobA/MobL family protein [Burkholderiaceae bacterium]